MTSHTKFNLALWAAAVLYAVLLLLKAIHTPLRLDETLQFAAVKDHSLSELLVAVAASPGAAPLHYLLQSPFVNMIENPRLATRLLSVIWAAVSLPLFWQLCQKVRAPHAVLALCLFALLPSHFMFAAAGRPFEQALFFLLLGLFFFCGVTSEPNLRTTVLYSASLLLAIYSEPLAILPAAGCLLFFLRGVATPKNRRTFWYLLPATALPALLYLPYAIWSVPQSYATWLTTAPPTGSLYQQALQSLTGSGTLCEILSAVLLVSGVIVAWRGVRSSVDLIPFCFFGGLFVTVAVILPLDFAQRSPVWPSHLVFLAPILALLAAFAVRQISIPWIAMGAFAVPVILATTGSFEDLVKKPAFDPEAEAHAVRAAVKPDACVVYVSEGLSRWLFVPFEPSLDGRECKDFFHIEIVLAVHPFVRLDQMEDARSFFKGLNMRQASHESAGGGQIVVLRAGQ